MRKIKHSLVTITVMAAGLFAFTNFEAGAIRGRVTPADGAFHVMAISGRDTVTANITLGEFLINSVKPGSYIVIIDAHAPYRDVVRDGIVVTDGNVVDLGEIQLPR